jgi:hypothetical protein
VLISLLCEVLAHAAHVAVIYYGIHHLGVAITGWGAIASFAVFTLLMRWATGRTTGFQWSGSVLKLQWLGGLAIGVALAISMRLPLEWSLAAGSVLLLSVGWYCLRQLGSLSGLNHSGAVDRLLRLFRLKRA